MRRYRKKSWLDARIEVRESPIQGRGLFATAPITGDTVLIIWGGHLLTEEDLKAGKARRHSITAVDEGFYLASLADEQESPDDLMNHSCDPNLWMKDEVTLVARRGIAAGEELTVDYAVWEADESWISAWRCRCGSDLCRGVCTGKDWRLPDLQLRYGDHFSPFINRRIQRLKRREQE